MFGVSQDFVRRRPPSIKLARLFTGCTLLPAPTLRSVWFPSFMCTGCSRSPAVEIMDVPTDDYSSYFREVHGRKVNVLNERYALPADDEELKVRALFTDVPSFRAYCGFARHLCSGSRYFTA